jgi:anti-sigma28 factor (negative regulator of flagellin synthesis)
MKVPGSDGNENVLKRVQEGRVGEQGAARRAPTTNSATEGLSAELHRSKADTMKFSSLGAAISQELDPVKIAEERRAKIESLKEQIRSGSYKPPVDNIAQAFGEEISTEIILGARFAVGEEG